MLIALSLLIQKLFLLPKLIVILTKDLIRYILTKDWKTFRGWGIHVYTGAFGASKTSSMVHDAYCTALRYPDVAIMANFKLQNFPAHTKIMPLASPQDILNAPNNTLVLVDEIGTIFNSRDFAKGKGSVPKILFQHICQCRKRHIKILGTSQRWCFVDKQLRDVTATVNSCSIAFKDPFSRLATVKTFDAVDYDRWYSNPLLPLAPLSGNAYIQTDKIRNLYDTSELVKSMLSAEYVDDEEILRNQGYEPNLTDISKDGKRAYRKGKKLA